ncbi:hypothetical protein, partial [Enterococcus sp. CSURQ0835]|uniref:hypothetical protein n=1 Tax=Enterococcus sp. CSURQ0835 TaxID=2681394 RepID=UPI001F18C049
MGSIPIIRPREWKKSSDIVRLTQTVDKVPFWMMFTVFSFIIELKTNSMLLKGMRAMMSKHPLD